MSSLLPSVATATTTINTHIQPTLLFLDIDGVLNRIREEEDEEERREKKKTQSKKHRKNEKKREREATVDATHDADYDSAQNEPTTESHQPATRDNGASFTQTEETCCVPPFSSPLSCVPSLSRIQSILAELDMKESFDADLLHHLCHAMHAKTCRLPEIVHTSTWRLQPKSLKQIHTLFEQLGIIAIDDTNQHPSCSGICHPLSSTPDLKGWAARIEEILAFLQTRLKQGCDSLPPFIILDDMDLFSGVSLTNKEAKTTSLILDELRSRTIKVDGSTGLMEGSMRTVASMLDDASSPPSSFVSAVVKYDMPSCPY